MTRYTPRQVATVAASAGFQGKALVRAVAVALAESGGDPQAVNVNSDSTRSRDRGLWQINSRWHPEVSDAQAFNPLENARAAFRISAGGRDWSQWSTWKNGSAGAQLGRARMAVAQLRKAGGVQNVDDIPGFPDPLIPLIPDPFGVLPGDGGLLSPDNLPWHGVSEALQQITLMAVKTGIWISDPHNWLRVAWMAGGVAGVLIALEMIGKSGAAGTAGKAAAKAVTDRAAMAGKVAKVVALKKVG